MASRWVNLTDADQSEILGAIKEGSPLYKKLEKAQKRISVRSAKNKGANLQKWVAERLGNMLGIAWDNSDDDSPIAVRQMGQHGEDVILRGEARKRFLYSIECKSQENMNLVETIEQVKANTKPSQDWLIVHKRKAIPSAIVIMDWYAFENLWRKANETV